MSKHTPGPWIMRRGTLGTSRYHLAEMMPSAYPDMPLSFAPADEQEANARLIAAAPELLEALQRAQVTLLSASRGRLTPDEINDAAYEARAAIASATGDK